MRAVLWMPAASSAAIKGIAYSIPKMISVSGFAGIHDELLSARNFYGIRADIVYDDDHNRMNYSLAIPIKLLQTDAASSKEWPFSIKINRNAERKAIKVPVLLGRMVRDKRNNKG